MFKLGPEIGPGGGECVRLATEGNVAVVKLRDDFGAAADILAAHPDILLVGRATEPAELDPLNDYLAGKSAQQAAAEFVSRQQAKYDANPLIRVWEGPNETGLAHGSAEDPEVQSRMAWYSDFEDERQLLMLAQGRACVIGNFSTGTPDLGLWPFFLPALQSAALNDNYLGLHEYGGGFMWHDTGDGLGWNTLRYRRVPEIVASGVRLVITECGLDSVQGPPGYTNGAWRSMCPQWESHGDLLPGETCEGFYVRQLVWYEGELSQDNYVAGACLFTCDSADGWRDYTVHNAPEILDGLIAASLAEPEPEEPMYSIHTMPRPATARYGLTVRDLAGTSVGTVETGETVFVYETGQTVAGYTDRAFIEPVATAAETIGRKHIWEGTPENPSLEYL